MTQKVVAGIPAHNEADYIGPVIRAVSSLVQEVIVVDDGSSDSTAARAREAGARVISHPRNLGYGAAIRSCVAAALAADADVLVTLDSDGQHDPADLPEVIAPILARQADLVVGSRFLGRPNNVPRYRRFGISVITFLFNLGHPPVLTDAQSGFRAFSRAALQDLVIEDPGMGASVEVLIRMRARGLRMVEVPVACHYHAGGSSLHPVRHGVGVALQVIVHRARERLRT